MNPQEAKIEQLQARLSDFVRAHCGEACALQNVGIADGHAGLTYLFDVASRGAALRSYVLKLAPAGVRRSGNTDVYRQAPLLRALAKDRLPVPGIPWAGEDESWFGAPFVVMERLPGRIFNYWDPSDLAATAAQCESKWRQAVELLPRVHRYDWRARLPDWQEPESLQQQVVRWRPVYRKAPEPSWVNAAERVERRLLESLPQDSPIGLIHGDYQPGNILYLDDRITGIIDWELSGIGPQLLDLGWLMMKSADRSGWSVQARTIAPPDVRELRDIYERASGRTHPSIPWFHALAQFRWGAIACFNVRLHRKGQRHDPMWEEIAMDLPGIFDIAEALL